MKLYICNNSHTYIWDFFVPLNAWYGQDNKGWWICTKHAPQKDGYLYLRRFNGITWIESLEKSATTNCICRIATKNKLWYTKVTWFKAAEKVIKKMTKKEQNHNNYANMMKHDRRHKSGGGSGTPLWKDYKQATITFTDYECTKYALNDFPTCYN